jgi:hypothetical protein
MSIDPSFIPATPSAFLGTAPLGAVPVPLPQTPASGAPPADAEAAADGVPLFDGEGFSFSDVLDLINPLQHLPVISTLYRDLTGDEIGAGARVLGGALFGGIPGVVSSLVNVVIEDETGKDFGEHVLALFDDPAGEVSETAYAAVDRFNITPGTKGAQARSAALVTDPTPVSALAAAPAAGPETAPIRLAAGKTNWDRTAPSASPVAMTLMADNQATRSLFMADIAHDAYRTADAARGGTAARTGSYA